MEQRGERKLRKGRKEGKGVKIYIKQVNLIECYKK